MRTAVFLPLLVLLAVAQAVSFADVIEEEWHNFKLEHHKNYKDETEERFRLKVFLENKHEIAKHNQLFAEGKVSFKLGVNQFADMLSHEFSAQMNGFDNTLQEELRLKGATFISPAHMTLPKSVDWRDNGAVTEVKNQGSSCGSCWAFSTTGSLEGQYFRKTGVLVSLSEQNLIDCSTTYGNNGCKSGRVDNALLYIKDNGGIDTEMSYPYEAINDTCHFNKDTIGATDTGFVYIPQGDEQKLAEAVATIGPISVAIDGSKPSFGSYTGGVYIEPACDRKNLTHAVLVVGFGTDESDQDYWLVKNSWGPNWGEKGYIKMLRNGNNQCGIASCALFPLV